MTFKERLEAALEAHNNGPLIARTPQEVTIKEGMRRDFYGGARAALLLAAEDLAQHDTHRYTGDMNRAYNAAMDFCDEQIRSKAAELAEGEHA